MADRASPLRGVADRAHSVAKSMQRGTRYDQFSTDQCTQGGVHGLHRSSTCTQGGVHGLHRSSTCTQGGVHGLH